MTQLPFLIPEYDLNLRISRMMIIIEILALNKKKTPTLTVGKLGLYDFLIRYPIVLINLLRDLGKQVAFNLRDTEFGTVETNNIDISELYEYEATRQLIQVMISMGLIRVELIKTEACVVTTEKGVAFVTSLETDYLIRMKELAQALKPLQVEKETQLRDKITLCIRGG
jgi:hypothetical protein